MKRLLPIACAALLSAAGLLLNTTAAHAFGGEDPVFGHPWYHEKISREAAKAAGFSFNPQMEGPDLPKANIALEIANLLQKDPRRQTDSAAEAIAWHADYLDSYLYSPIWWAAGQDKNGDQGPAGILKRYKVSRAVETELKNMHFDDLFSSDKVNGMWRRYASGTFAGLLWASEQNNGEGDVYAAQNILGASLHAVEDFYSHSSWIDKPERRTQTYFEYPRAQTLADNLYTGAYEKDHQLGVKPHGKWIPKDMIWAQPGVKQIMEIACDPASPFSNSEECAAWKAVKAGTPMTPNVGGIKLPESIMVYTPAGIALDNTWAADEAVKQRGLDIQGSQAFAFAHDLAVRQATQWLKTMGEAMGRAQKGAFWEKIQKTSASEEQRIAQFENYGQFPFMFMAAGPYPPANVGNAEEWYLRVKLRTANEANAGTDSDIRVNAGGQSFLLDYLPKANPIMAYNDFEAGDNDSYVIGPFESCPDKIELVNDAADGKELVEAAGRDFVNAVESTVQSIGDTLLNIVGGHADKVAVNKQLWMPNELANMPMGGAGVGFNIPLNGGKEGNYRANGTIFKVGEDDSNYQFEVHIDSLYCIKESTFDRFSSEDEPFLLCVLNPLPGDQQQWLSPVYQGVDTGETVNVEHGFGRVSIPKSSGMLNLALTLMESDDESQKNRQELLEKFAGTYKDKTEGANRTLTAALATTLAANWKLADIEVVAWSRNGTIRQGTVLRQNVNRWVEPRKPVPFPLDVNAARSYGVTTDELLPQLQSDNKPPVPTDPVPTEPVPTEPIPTDPVPTDPIPTEPVPPVPTPTPKPGGPVITPPGIPTNPVPTNPQPQPGKPLPGTGTQTPPATTGGNFLPLKDFAIRVDSAAPNTAGDKLEVFATLKNRLSAIGTINGSMIYAVATDADGVGFMSDTAFYRPTGEPTLMAGNRDLDPAGELKVRLLITIPEGTSQLKTLTLWETKSLPQTVDISNVSFPGVRPSANLGSMGLNSATTEFKPCGESLDVRFDGFRKARSGWYEAFFTFKNSTDTGLRSDVLDFNSSSLDVFTRGADGGKQRYDTLMRANGEKAIWIPIHYAIISGGEARVRYTFSAKNDVPQPIKVTVGDRVSGTTLEWSVTP